MDEICEWAERQVTPIRLNEMDNGRAVRANYRPPRENVSISFRRVFGAASLRDCLDSAPTCDNLVTIFRRFQRKSAVVFAMASGCNL